MGSSVTRTGIRNYYSTTTGIAFGTAYESTLGPYVYGGQNDYKVVPAGIYGIK